MKYIAAFICVIYLLLAGCTPNQHPEEIHESEIKSISSSFDWLQGNWTRSNGRGLIITKENWIRTEENQFVGLGFTLDHGDTIFQEKMTFVLQDSNWVLTVYGVNNKPTAFRMTEQTNQSFHVSNPNNKFPTDIEYRINKDTLEAVVFNADEEILFQFVQPNAI